MGRADLHVHTLYSNDGMASVASMLKAAAETAKLDLLAITDHDTLRGAFEARELGPKYGVQVVIGCEISTAAGHLLAYFLTRPIPTGLTLEETLYRVGNQGGLAVAAHPFAHPGVSLGGEAVRRARQQADLRKVLVGVEAYNASMIFERTNLQAAALAQALDMAQVGGSDAHSVSMLGNGLTFYPGYTPGDLRRALEKADTRLEAGERRPLPRLLLGFGARWLLRRAGWVTFNPEPHDPYRMERLEKAIHTPSRPQIQTIPMDIRTIPLEESD